MTERPLQQLDPEAVGLVHAHAELYERWEIARDEAATLRRTLAGVEHRARLAIERLRHLYAVRRLEPGHFDTALKRVLGEERAS